MLSKSDRAKAAAILIEAERSKKQGKQLSVTFPKIDIDDAYAIQQEVTKQKLKSGRKVIGHKIGLTSKAMQQSLGINEPDYGHLFDDMLVADGAKLAFEDYCVPRIEVELAFVLEKPLKGPGVGLIDVLRATEYVVPSLEIIDARLINPRKIFDTVADNGAAAGIVIGGRVMEPDDFDLRWAGAILYKNSEIEETGLAAGVLGHPALGIAWLANKLGPRGVTLQPGHILLSGSFTRPVHAAKGDTIHADFGPLGGLAIQFV